jgi:hypothetical protein
MASASLANGVMVMPLLAKNNGENRSGEKPKINGVAASTMAQRSWQLAKAGESGVRRKLSPRKTRQLLVSYRKSA